MEYLLPTTWETSKFETYAAEALAQLDPVIVVLPTGDAVPEPRRQRALTVRRQVEGGCSMSLRAGMAAVPGGAAAVAVVPGDQPGLSADLIRLAVRAWLQARPKALTLSFRGQPGHPLIFSRALRDRLHGLEGEKGMWRLLEELGDGVVRVPVDAPMPADVDTWEDYLRLTRDPSPLLPARHAR